MKPGTSRFEARTFGKYTLLARLAVGGMAEIFLARVQAAGGFEKLFVIKRILPHYANDPQFVTMFLDEARIAARISHPNVCQVFELGEVDGQYFLAMEYLAGVPLSRLRGEKVGPLEPRLVAGMMLQAAEGLHHAHLVRKPDGEPAGVVHRDVSPQNLFVTVDGVVKVLDFGIAKAQDATTRTRTGTVKGKYAFMSPEQLRGEALDGRSDVFALGVITWEMLTGRHLFQRDTDYLIFMAITHERIPSVREVRPEVPASMAQAVAMALSQDRDTRFLTARAFGEALSRAAEPLGGPFGQAAIALEVETRFSDYLAEQRELVQKAREQRATLEIEVEDAKPTTLAKSTSSGRTEGRRNFSTALIMLFLGLILGAGGLTAWHYAPGQQLSMPEPEPVPAAAPAASPAAAPDPVAAAAPAPAPDAAPDPDGSRVPTGFAGHPGPGPAPSRPGFLSIDSQPVYSVIYVDGRRVGETPLVRQPLRPGRHSVKAVSSSGGVKTFAVQIAAGKEAPPHRLEW